MENILYDALHYYERLNEKKLVEVMATGFYEPLIGEVSELDNEIVVLKKSWSVHKRMTIERYFIPLKNIQYFKEVIYEPDERI